MRMESDMHEEDPAVEPPESLQNRGYPHYRRLCLPVNNTLMESLIKEMNYQVKGSEKSWNNPDGANHIITVIAAALSEDERLIPKR
jgi:hypothetical protein